MSHRPAAMSLTGLTSFVSLLALSSEAVPSVRLWNGVEMPVMALGTTSASDASIKAALDAGFRYVDTAYTYGTQRAISHGLLKGGAAKLRRSELFIGTKVPGAGVHGVRPNFAEADTLARVQDDLRDLSSSYDVGYLDLVLLHWPACARSTDTSQTYPFKTVCFKEQNACSGPGDCETIRQQWAALETAYAKNLTRAIGVSNFCPQCFKCLAGSNIPPMVNQVQFHVGMGGDPQGFLSFHHKSSTVLMAYSPLGCSGPDCSSSVGTEIREGDLTTGIGRQHGKSAVQVALKWILSHNVTLATMSSNPQHLQDDLDVFDFELSADEMRRLDGASFAKENPVSFMCHGSSSIQEFV